MTDLTWLPPTLVAGAGVVLTAAVYRLQRKQARDVKWTAEVVNSSPAEARLVVTNTGISRAHGTRLELDPLPGTFDGSLELGDVDLGARRSVSWVRAWGVKQPARVTVHWRGRLGRPQSWTTEL